MAARLLLGIWKFIEKYRMKVLFFISGISALVWFFIRVIPKPSRAAYPCQRAAFPIASSFVIWLTGSFISFFSFKKASLLYSRRKLAGMALLGVGILSFTFTYIFFPSQDASANLVSPVVFPELKAEPVANQIEPKASVAIVKSDKDSTSQIKKDEVESMVRKAVKMAGGMDKIIKDGDTVVIKPNIILYDYRRVNLPAEGNGMSTDWRVVAATAKIVRELNPHGKIFVMEGSMGNSTAEGYKVLNYTKESIPEVDSFLAMEEVSGNYLEFNSPKLVGVKLPETVKLYPDSLKRYHSAVYYYNKIYYRAKVVISLPVLKNHQDAGVTGAVKNLGIGATPTNIYGVNSGPKNGRWAIPQGEKMQSIDHQPNNLHKWIHDYYYGRPAQFAIMDGLQGYAYGPIYNSQPTEG